jgi:hypothetical protein
LLKFSRRLSSKVLDGSSGVALATGVKPGEGATAGTPFRIDGGTNKGGKTCGSGSP